tara:strand:+ start:1003 stop:1533 length:531 start_codon:yes stop_codon:yes gene_type:complete
MKYLITLIFLIFSFQSSRIIELKDFYSGKGVIFDESEPYPFKDLDYKKPYTPTIEDIKKAENFLFDNYYQYKVKVFRHFNYDENLINKLLKPKYKKAQKVKKKFCKYNRQYAGYINSSNDTIIYIGLLNFSNKKKAEQQFNGWQEKILIGFGDFYEKNQDFYNINISKDEFIYKLE